MSTAFFSAGVTWEEQRGIMDGLRQDPPNIKVLFLTPEKVAQSDSILRALDALYARGALVGALLLPGFGSGTCQACPGQQLPALALAAPWLPCRQLEVPCLGKWGNAGKLGPESSSACGSSWA